MNTLDSQSGPIDSSMLPTPMVPSTPAVEPLKWYQIWWQVWRHPGADTFRSILQQPNTSPSRSFLWVGLTAFVSGLLSAIILAIFPSENQSVAFLIICNVIGAPIGAVLGLVLFTAIYHGIARLFGGSGRWEQLLFCFAAIDAPETLLGILGYLFIPGMLAARGTGNLAAMSIPLLCFVGIVFIVGLYSLVLFVFAIAGAENLSGGKAVLVYLVPSLVVIALGACLVIFALSVSSGTQSSLH